jgi:hypothetical protein
MFTLNVNNIADKHQSTLPMKNLRIMKSFKSCSLYVNLRTNIVYGSTQHEQYLLALWSLVGQ